MAKKAYSDEVFTVSVFGQDTPSGVYTTLRPLCRDWGLLKHYMTIWRAMNADLIYSHEDKRKIKIKKLPLNKRPYTKKQASERNTGTSNQFHSEA